MQMKQMRRKGPEEVPGQEGCVVRSQVLVAEKRQVGDAL